MKMQVAVDHFYSSVLSCLALNESEAGVDLVLIISSLFLCKLLLISMRRASFSQEKQGGSHQKRSPPASLSFKGQATEQATAKW